MMLNILALILDRPLEVQHTQIVVDNDLITLTSIC